MEKKANKIENAIITSTMLGYEDHGCFTYMLYLDREVGSQGFGGYVLAASEVATEKQNSYGMASLKQILDVVGVSTWEQLKGRHIRIAVPDEWNASIQGIGNFLKDKWFYPKELGKEYFSEDKDV